MHPSTPRLAKRIAEHLQDAMDLMAAMDNADFDHLTQTYHDQMKIGGMATQLHSMHNILTSANPIIHQHAVSMEELTNSLTH